MAKNPSEKELARRKWFAEMTAARNRDPEFIKRVSEARKGQKRTPKQVENIRKGALRRFRNNVAEREKVAKNTRAQLERMGYNPNSDGKNGHYVRDEAHRKKMSEILKKRWQEPGRRGVRSIQQRQYMNERYRSDPVFYAKYFEAAKKARSSEAWKEYHDWQKQQGEHTRIMNAALKKERQEQKYESQKARELQRRKYNEACRVLADYGVTPLKDQEIAYYDQIIAYFSNMG